MDRRTCSEIEVRSTFDSKSGTVAVTQLQKRCLSLCTTAVAMVLKGVGREYLGISAMAGFCHAFNLRALPTQVRRIATSGSVA